MSLLALHPKDDRLKVSLLDLRPPPQEVYGMMAKARVPPNHSTFTLLLETLAKGGRLKAALAVSSANWEGGVEACMWSRCV